MRAEVRGLGKRYPTADRPALEGVDLGAEPGEVLAVVGESGSGKTTLLRLVAGLEVPDSGEVRIGRRTVAGPGSWIQPEKRGVGMVFQDFALFPHMTVRENVAYGLRSVAPKERRERVEAMLDRVGLDGLGDRYPHQLSGGQRQRVAVARALAPEPGLLLLDEPFSNLDAPLKAELRNRIAALLARARVTTILVVHEADDIFHLADRVAVLRKGRLLQVGTPEMVYAEPIDEHVARLFGEVNSLPARRVEGGIETPLGFLSCPDPGIRRPRVLVRPEDLVLASGAEQTPAAVVREIRRRGSRCRIRLALDEGADDLPMLLADVKDPPEGLEEGRRIGVTVRPGAFRVLSEGSG